MLFHRDVDYPCGGRTPQHPTSAPMTGAAWSYTERRLSEGPCAARPRSSCCCHAQACRNLALPHTTERPYGSPAAESDPWYWGARSADGGTKSEPAAPRPRPRPSQANSASRAKHCFVGMGQELVGHAEVQQAVTSTALGSAWPPAPLHASQQTAPKLDGGMLDLAGAAGPSRLPLRGPYREVML